MKKSDLISLKPKDIRISLTCDGNEEAVDNWKRIYCIDERYNSFCCSVSNIAYISNIISGSFDAHDVMSMFERLKYYDSNFLKLAFLKGAMEKLGINK